MSARRELVWKAWTDPQLVTRWWGPKGFTTTTEVMDCSHRRYAETRDDAGPDGVNYPNLKICKEVVKLEKFVYSPGGQGEGKPAVHFISTI